MTGLRENPKDVIGSGKLPIDLVPDTAISLISLAHLEGGLKYGFWNWRHAGIRMSVYIAALKRHIAALENGEDLDPDSGLWHPAHIGACNNIIIDAHACGKLIDDRPPRVNIRGWFTKLTGHVSRLKAKYADKNPKHFTIADTEQKVAANDGFLEFRPLEAKDL